MSITPTTLSITPLCATQVRQCFSPSSILPCDSHGPGMRRSPGQSPPTSIVRPRYINPCQPVFSATSSSSRWVAFPLRPAEKSGGVLTRLRRSYPHYAPCRSEPISIVARDSRVVPTCDLFTVDREKSGPSTRYNHSNGRRRNVMLRSVLDAPGRTTCR